LLFVSSSSPAGGSPVRVGRRASSPAHRRRISDESPAAVQLLGICAYLALELIPLDLFTMRPGELPSR
jgi:hypothetical protein